MTRVLQFQRTEGKGQFIIMVNLIGTEAMLHISFSLAAFVFSVVLYILICVLGTGQVHKNLKFRTFTVIVVIGNFISILDNIFRDSGLFPTPVPVKLLLLLLVYLANILLTYYMALYMEGFFGDFRYQRFFLRLNSILVLSAVIFTVAVYVLRLILYPGEEALDSFPVWIRVLLGYVFELYYLIYVFALFVIFRKKLSSRARFTSVAAFTVSIGSVLFELLNTLGLGSGILLNYFGAVLGLYIFYIGVETPDYQNLLRSISDLDEARRAADEANRSKSDFLANMSHEIRTPINAVLGMNEMILREAEDDNILLYADNIQNAGGTLLGLINDILDFSKIEAGRLEIIPVDYDLSAVIHDLVNMIHNRADEKGLKLKLEFNRNIPRLLNGDEVRVKQIITNILTNAVKYTEEGSISFILDYTGCEADPDSIMLKVAVKDTGIGIKSEDLPKLFSEFERIEEKRNRNIEGTGLGMSITNSLLKMMNSSLKVDSTYGVGSTFSFELKQRVVGRDPLGDFGASYLEHLNRHKNYRASFTAPEAKLLVVDDNPMNLMVFKGLLKQTLVIVDTADSSDKGIELAEKNKYDVVFLDHMMPNKDGVEMLHELRNDKDGPNVLTPMICLTANAISGAREQYLHEGFEGYLSKPIDFEELEELLLNFLPEEKVSATAEDGKVGEAAGDPGIPENIKTLGSCGIDVEKGIEQVGGIDDYRLVLQLFKESADEYIGELETFIEAEDYAGYAVKVHALKSSARTIGAVTLGAEAQMLENSAKSGDSDYILKHHREFIEKCIKLKDNIEKTTTP